jgi:hypothetical protein
MMVYCCIFPKVEILSDGFILINSGHIIIYTCKKAGTEVIIQIIFSVVFDFILNLLVSLSHNF